MDTRRESRGVLSEAFRAALTVAFGDRPQPNEPLARHTTSRLGGPADIWLPVYTTAELITAVTLARQHAVPVFMLGSGANMLIGDGGIRGLVIENRAGHVQFPEIAGDDGPAVVVAESGTVLPSLARRCGQLGLSGLEWAVGVPGTLGGAVVNNAGAYGSNIAANLVRAELLSPDNRRVWQPIHWFEYRYRSSRLKAQARNGWIVLRAELHLAPAPVSEVQARMSAYNERRKNTQPPGATMGSMFKNPPDDYAGRLIDEAGLKGKQIGQAQVSTIHANFFKNLGKATAADMLALIELVQQTVENEFRMKLELEIEVVGEFS